MKAAGGVPNRNHITRLKRLAGERADAQARRIPWQRLLETRNRYIDWQEFYLWVRTVLEVENRLPEWMVEILNKRCAGFLASQEELSSKAAKDRPLALRLEAGLTTIFLGLPNKKTGSVRSPFTPFASISIKELKSAGRSA